MSHPQACRPTRLHSSAAEARRQAYPEKGHLVGPACATLHVRVPRIAGHANVSTTLNTYADEFDKAMHRDDLSARIAQAGFGAVR